MGNKEIKRINEGEMECPICGADSKYLNRDYSWDIVKCENCGEFVFGRNDEKPNLTPQEIAVLRKYLNENNRFKNEGRKLQILKSTKEDVFSMINKNN